MKIALIYSKFPPIEDGGADYLEHLAHTFVSMGHEVSVFTSSWVSIDKAIQYPFPVFPIVTNWGLPLISKGSSWNTLLSMISSFDPDIIQVIFPDSTLGGGYQLPYLIGFFNRKIPVVAQFFSFSSSSSNLLGKLGVAAMLLNSHAIFLHCEQIIDEFTRKLPIFRSKTYLIPVGNNLDGTEQCKESKSLLHQALNWSGEHFHLGFYGAMDPSKGIDTLIEAVARLAPEYPYLRLHFIGGHTSYKSDYPDQVDQMIRNFKLEQITTNSGYVSREDICTQLAACDICVLPFKRNVLGRSSLVSALATGLPVITTRLTKRSDYFLDRQNVLLVPPSDPIALSYAIQELINDDVLRNRIGQNATLLAKRLSWEVIASQSIAVYDRLRTNRGIKK